MITVAELVATLGLDDRTLSRDLDQSLGRAEGRLGRFGTVAKTAIAGAAGAGLAAVLHTGYAEVMDAAKVNAQIEAGIKSTGGAANVTVDHLNELASAIQEYSGQTDDSIAQTEALLLTFTNIKNVGADKIFDQATMAAADMAAKMGGDASGAAIQLGKALNDPVKGVTALQRVGVSFTEGQKTQIKAMVESGNVMGAQKIILAELQKEFGGAAKAAGESLPGQLERTKRSFEDVSQELMTQAMPAIQSILGVLRKLAPHVGTIIKLAGAFAGVWAAAKGYKMLKEVSSTVSDVAGTFRRGGSMARIFQAGMGGARGGAGSLAKVLGKGGALGIALAFTTTSIMGAVDAWKQYSDAAKKAEEAYQGAKSNASKAEQYIIDKYGKGSPQHKKWLAKTKSAREGIEEDRYEKPWWDVTSWFAGGGDFIARRPQIIGVGEAGPERVTITPLSRGGASAGSGDIYLSLTVPIYQQGAVIGEASQVGEAIGKLVVPHLRKLARTGAF